jgi:MFS family permease
MNQSLRRAAVGIPGFCAFLILYAPQSLLPTLAQEFGATPAEISLTMTATRSPSRSPRRSPARSPTCSAQARDRRRDDPADRADCHDALDAEPARADRSAFRAGLVLPPIFTVVVAYIGEEWPPAEATGVTGLYMAATSVGGFCGRFFAGLLADTSAGATGSRIRGR